MKTDIEFKEKRLTKGTWVVMDFELWVLTKDEEADGMAEVSTGCISTYANVRKRSFPLTLWTRSIQMFFKRLYKSLQEDVGTTHVNWPDIKQWYCQKFNEAINIDSNDLKSSREEVVQFNADVLLALKEMKEIKVAGISLMKKG